MNRARLSKAEKGWTISWINLWDVLKKHLRVYLITYIENLFIRKSSTWSIIWNLIEIVNLKWTIILIHLVALHNALPTRLLELSCVILFNVGLVMPPIRLEMCLRLYLCTSFTWWKFSGFKKTLLKFTQLLPRLLKKLSRMTMNSISKDGKVNKTLKLIATKLTKTTHANFVAKGHKCRRSGSFSCRMLIP